MKDCLIIFAKEPKAGKVKTRLQGYLSQEMCVKLYKAFLKDTVEIARRVNCKYKIIAYESNGNAPNYLKTIAAPFQFYEQKGENLGRRMYNAFKFALRKGSQRTVIIGSDSPTMPVAYIKDAFDWLKTADIVLGPSLDGGYYLIGLRKPRLSLFKNIRWSSKTALADTLKNVQRLKKAVSLLPHWYDVDEPSALAILKRDLKKKENSCVAKRTKRFFQVL